MLLVLYGRKDYSFTIITHKKDLSIQPLKYDLYLFHLFFCEISFHACWKYLKEVSQCRSEIQHFGGTPIKHFFLSSLGFHKFLLKFSFKRWNFSRI